MVTPIPQPVVELPRPSAPRLEPVRPSQLAFLDAPIVFALDQLTVHYGDKLAVKDVVMDIRAKQVTAFIGPSGCGKTTVLR